MPHTFGSQLRLVRERLKISQEALGARAGFDKAHISNLERDKKRPSIAAVDRLAKALDVAPFDLVRGTDMLGPYAAQRSSPNDQAIQADAEARRRSAKIVAIHEVYKRIVELFNLHLWGHVLNGADAYGEAYLGFLDDALSNECAAAAAEFRDELACADQLFVPSTLDPSQYVIEGIMFDNESQEYDERALRKSEAMILKVLLKYAASDDVSTRRDISERLGLAKVDAYIEKVEQERAVSNANAEEVLRNFKLP